MVTLKLGLPNFCSFGGETSLSIPLRALIGNHSLEQNPKFTTEAQASHSGWLNDSPNIDSSTKVRLSRMRMCGRAYSTYTEEELYLRYLTEKSKRNPLGLQPNFNIAPTQICPIVLIREGEKVIQMFRWGLVPSWAKDLKSAAKYSLINAKAEEITEKKSYKEAFQRRRCIVPFSGFFEWANHPGTPKKPFAVRLKDHSIMSLAGVWENWKSRETGETVDSFSIITTSANSLTAKVHHRMPVILDPKQENEWIDPNSSTDQLQKLMRPCPSEWLHAYEVSTLVNSPRNNTPEVLKPA